MSKLALKGFMWLKKLKYFVEKKLFVFWIKKEIAVNLASHFMYFLPGFFLPLTYTNDSIIIHLDQSTVIYIFFVRKKKSGIIEPQKPMFKLSR